MAAGAQQVVSLLIVFTIFAQTLGQEGGLLYHDFRTYQADQVPEGVTDQEQQAGHQQYQHYATFDRTEHGHPEIALLNGHTQGWSEYLTGLFNIQSLEFISAGAYLKDH